MIKITIGNSTSQIEGLSIEQHKKLAKVLSYTVDPQSIYFGGGYQPRQRSLLGTKGDFPTGLLYLVTKWLEPAKVPPVIVDTRVVPKPCPGLIKAKLAHTPYPEQKAAAEAAKALKRGIICAPTGCGKSLIVALIAEKLQVPTLIVVPSLELKRQLTSTLQSIFGASKVGDYRQSRVIAVENVDALEEKPELIYQCVIIDEFHHSGAATYRKLNKKSWNTVYYKFGVTATPFRSQDNERLLLESVLSKVIYRVDYKTAVEKGYIVPLEAYYIEVPPTLDIKGNSTSWASMYSELVVNNDKRNELVSQILVKLHVIGASTLCLVKEIDHGQQISDMCNLDFAHGSNEHTPKLITAFNEERINALIGTSGILGEGVDTRPCEYVIIAGLGKSKNAFMQQCGRGFRRHGDKESAKVIIFKDTSHKWTLTHFRAQCKILMEEYGVKAIKL